MYVPELVKDRLGDRYACDNHAMWLLQNNDFRPTAEAAVAFIRNPSSQNISIIKEGKNREGKPSFYTIKFKPVMHGS